jgi:ParB family chromosome partitioning protein
MITMMKIKDIKIGRRFRKNLEDAHIRLLAETIQEVGLLHPVVVTPQKQLVAGQYRIEACKRLGWKKVPVHIVDLEEIVRGEFIENLVRKDFLPSEAVAIAEAVRPLEEKGAKERQRLSKGRGKKVGKIATPFQGKTRDKIARYVGMSGRTLDKARGIIEAAKQEPEKFGRFVEIMDRTRRIDSAYRQLRWEKQNIDISETPNELKPPPTGGRQVMGIRWVHPKTGEVKYELRIGPNAAGTQFPSMVAERKQSPEYRRRLDEADAMLKRAEDLRLEAEQVEKLGKELRADVKEDIRCEIEAEQGPIESYVETFDIEILDKELRSQLARLGKKEADQIGAMLLSKLGSEKILLKDYGMWGDLVSGFKSSDFFDPRCVSGWTRMGGMDGLAEVE